MLVSVHVSVPVHVYSLPRWCVSALRSTARNFNPACARAAKICIAEVCTVTMQHYHHTMEHALQYLHVETFDFVSTSPGVGEAHSTLPVHVVEK